MLYIFCFFTEDANKKPVQEDPLQTSQTTPLGDKGNPEVTKQLDKLGEHVF